MGQILGRLSQATSGRCLHGAQRAGEARRQRLDDLNGVTTALKPRGDWAIANANPTEIYIAYDQLADATQFRTLVRAKPLSPSHVNLKFAA